MSCLTETKNDKVKWYKGKSAFSNYGIVIEYSMYVLEIGIVYYEQKCLVIHFEKYFNKKSPS